MAVARVASRVCAATSKIASLVDIWEIFVESSASALKTFSSARAFANF